MLGVTATLASTGTGGFTIRLTNTPGQGPVNASITPLTIVATVAVVTVNVAVVEPPGTRMLSGSANAEAGIQQLDRRSARWSRSGKSYGSGYRISARDHIYVKSQPSRRTGLD